MRFLTTRYGASPAIHGGVSCNKTDPRTPDGRSLDLGRVFTKYGCIFLAGASLLLSGTACAENTDDRYWGVIEGFWPSIKSSARLDFPGTNIPGTELSLENEMGLSDREALPSVLLGARLYDNWRVEFEYYQLDRNGASAAGRDIHWGDLTFPVSAAISTKFDTTIYRLSGGYSFYKKPEAEVGVTLGLHITDFAIALSGNATTPNRAASFNSEQRDQLVPLPTIGLYGHYSFAKDWTLGGRVDYFSLDYDKYNGSLTNWVASVDWRFTKNFGVGLGYRYVDYKVSVSKDNFHGEVDYRFDGPTLFLEGAY